MKVTTATSTFNPSLFTSTNPKTLFLQRLYITTLARKQRPEILLSSTTRALTVKCSKNGSRESISGENGGNFKDILPGMVDERVEELLNKEENRILLDGLEKATQKHGGEKSDFVGWTGEPDFIGIAYPLLVLHRGFASD
ncbi:Uncharacterized protein Adt_10129 [Abeliophyllum distichum]|uniref:Uncharacterized protein n=1 Tax=Abeliophyllum distichum TaxID=126358 RepID=A0ABD1UJ39_9LAMI